MASSPQAAHLTQVHRLAQARLAAQVAGQVRLLWPLLDVDDLDATIDRWLQATVPIVQRQRAMSARLAADYVRAFRALELGPDPRYTPVLETVAPVEQITTSLTVVGPVSIKRGATLPGTVARARAVATAEANAARAAMRHVGDGGRGTITGSVAADSHAEGWARATSGKACYFCRMLASRGPVYREDTAGFDAHDGCGCTAEPVYDRDAAWPAGAREYRDTWNEVTRGLSGAKAIAAFRDAVAS
jgi:hypothetical protein